MNLLKNFLVLFPVLFLIGACSGVDDPKLAFEQGKFEKAYELWLPRALEGDQDAQNYLGIQYSLGLGVSKNYKEALKWYELAAKSGHPDAQRNYGDMYQYGRGVPRDSYQAFIWYFAASQQGHETALRVLKSITGNNNLTPNQQMHAKLEANKFIMDPAKRFMSHDTYIQKK